MVNLKEALQALLGVSAYTANAPQYSAISDDQIERMREMQGGNLSPQPSTRLRWFIADLEQAQYRADAGDISRAAQLYRAMRRDGMITGLLSANTSGLVRLPKRFYGDAAITAELQARNGTRSLFDDMCPPSELALLAADGRALGVGIAELVPVPGRTFPVLQRLDPEFLRYRWNEGRWYYLSVAGPIPLVPGDGRWVLHMPGGRVAPWNNALWPALGRAFITKEHASLNRGNYGSKLANPARAAVAPTGATEPQRLGFLAKLIAWGTNTVFELPPGWDVKIIEAKGEGYQVFKDEVATSDNEIMIAIAGQIVTVTGGAGFSNADIHQTIRTDIIKETADALAYTVNTQILPQYVASHYGTDKIATGALIDWDIDLPKDKNAESTALMQSANALTQLTQILAQYGLKVSINEYTTRFGIPTEPGAILAKTGEPEANPQDSAQ
jgi:hypothetical protein